MKMSGMPPVGATIEFEGRDYKVIDTAKTTFIAKEIHTQKMWRLHINTDWKLIREGAINKENIDWRNKKYGVPVGSIICFNKKNYEVVDCKKNKLVIREEGDTRIYFLNKMTPWKLVSLPKKTRPKDTDKVMPGSLLLVEEQYGRVIEKDGQSIKVAFFDGWGKVYSYGIPKAKLIRESFNPPPPPSEELNTITLIAQRFSGWSGNFVDFDGDKTHFETDYESLQKDIFNGCLPPIKQVFIRYYELKVPHGIVAGPYVNVFGPLCVIWVPKIPYWVPEYPEAILKLKGETLAFLNGISSLFSFISDGAYNREDIFLMLVLNKLKDEYGFTSALYDLATDQNRGKDDICVKAVKEAVSATGISREEVDITKSKIISLEESIKNLKEKFKTWPPKIKLPPIKFNNELEKILFDFGSLKQIKEFAGKTDNKEYIELLLASEITRVSALSNPRIPKDRLKKLVEECNEVDLEYLGENPSLGESILEYLISEYGTTTKAKHFVLHPNLTKDQIRKLTNICHEDVAGCFLRRKNLPLEVKTVLVKKVKEWQFDELELLAKNQKTAEEIMISIAKKKDYELESIIIKNPKITPKVLDVLSKSRNPQIREIVAKNVLTPKVALKRLLASKNTNVSESAKKTLSQL